MFLDVPMVRRFLSGTLKDSVSWQLQRCVLGRRDNLDNAFQFGPLEANDSLTAIPNQNARARFLQPRPFEIEC